MSIWKANKLFGFGEWALSCSDSCAKKKRASTDMLFASGNHTSVLSFSFTPVKPLKFTSSIDRFRMTFPVDGNGKNYLSDDLLFCVKFPLNL